MVNTDGLTVLGAGSEWFWSMLQFVVVAITLAGIYVQLRQARAANAFAQANAIIQEWNSERLVRRTLAVAIAVRDGGADAPLSVPFSPIGNFWETVATLVRARHTELAVVADGVGSACRIWWTVLEPEVRRIRHEEGADVWRDFEWLHREIVRLHRAQGIADDVYDREHSVAAVIASIPDRRATIADFESMRAMIVAPARAADGVPVEPNATATGADGSAPPNPAAC